MTAKSVETLYSHIASVAGRILVEGGSLLVMCGGAYLDKAIAELATDKRLRYNWTIAYLCKSNGSPLIHSRKVDTSYGIVKGRYEGKIVYDLIEAPPDPDGTDKSFHPLWGQSVKGVKGNTASAHRMRRRYYICDPCCVWWLYGGWLLWDLGGRRVIACDIDEEAVRTTRLRVRRLFGHDR
jgi:hypothetical protein